MLTNKLLLIVLSLMLVHPIGPKDPLDYDPNKPLGDVSPIHISVSQFEERYHKDVLIPQFIPFKPTHSGGRCNELLKNLDIEYINLKSNERFLFLYKGGLFYEIGISKNKKNEKLNDLLKVANSLK